MKYFTGQLICLIAVMAFQISTVAHAQTTMSPVERVNILKQVVEALKTAGEALEKLGDGVAHVVALGATGYDNVVERIQTAERFDLMAGIAETRGNNEIVLRTFKDYLRLTASSASSSAECPRSGRQLGPTWGDVRTTTGEILRNVSNLLRDVKSIRGDIVNEDAYQTLVVTLMQRQQLLAKFAQLPEPCSKEELALLKEAAARYEEYVAQLEWVQQAVAEYNRRSQKATLPK